MEIIRCAGVGPGCINSNLKNKGSAGNPKSNPRDLIEYKIATTCSTTHAPCKESRVEGTTSATDGEKIRAEPLHGLFNENLSSQLRDSLKSLRTKIPKGNFLSSVGRRKQVGKKLHYADLQTPARNNFLMSMTRIEGEQRPSGCTELL